MNQWRASGVGVGCCGLWGVVCRLWGVGAGCGVTSPSENQKSISNRWQVDFNN